MTQEELKEFLKEHLRIELYNHCQLHPPKGGCLSKG